MIDDRLIRDLVALDRPVAVDAAFADRLFGRLRDERRTRRRRSPFLLLAAALLIGASLTAVVIGSGSRPPTDAPIVVPPVTQTWSMPTHGQPIDVEFAIPADLDVVARDGGAYLAFTPKGDISYLLDGATSDVPPGGRGLRITDLAGATAHYSNGRPLGSDAASFIEGLTSHQLLRAEVDGVSSQVIGGIQGLTAELVDAAPDAHVDRDQVGTYFFTPSRLFVADLGDSIVVVQIWAANPDDLAEWLPDAQRVIDSIRFHART